MSHTLIYRFTALATLLLCFCLQMPARTPVELKITQVSHTPKGSLYQPVFQLEAKASASLPADEEVLMLRLYRQSEQAPRSKQDIYLTATTPGINRALHSAAATWTDKLELSLLPAGARHHYSFSIVTNRNEYFSNTVTGETPDAHTKREKSDEKVRILPVVFHIFDHKALPQMRFDAHLAAEWIASANAVLSNEAGVPGLTDTHVRLEAARQAPDGTPLAEAGIHRSSDTPMLCLDGRAEGFDLEHPHLYWNQDAYLNVLILPFALTGNYNFCHYPQFPKGYELSGCHTVEHPTLPHAIYLNSLMEPIHGTPFFLTALGYYLGLPEEHSGGIYGMNPTKHTHVGCTPQQAERVEYTLQHAWNTPGGESEN